jgi:hypothetical protein
VVVLVNLQQHPDLQTKILIFLSLFYWMALISIKPYKDKAILKLELVNEGWILITCHFNHLFLMDGEDIKIWLSYIEILLIVGIMVSNLANVGRDTIHKVVLFIKKYFENWRVERNLTNLKRQITVIKEEIGDDKIKRA